MERENHFSRVYRKNISFRNTHSRAVREMTEWETPRMLAGQRALTQDVYTEEHYRIIRPNSTDTVMEREMFRTQRKETTQSAQQHPGTLGWTSKA